MEEGSLPVSPPEHWFSYGFEAEVHRWRSGDFTKTLEGIGLRARSAVTPLGGGGGEQPSECSLSVPKLDPRLVPQGRPITGSLFLKQQCAHLDSRCSRTARSGDPQCLSPGPWFGFGGRGLLDFTLDFPKQSVY